MLRTWFMFERSCHLPHHLSPSHFVYSTKNECNIHFPHTDTYMSWKDSILLSSSHFCWKNNDWTWDCAVITRLRLERKIKACTSTWLNRMMQRLSTISSLQNVLPYFCANEPQQKKSSALPPRIHTQLQNFPMHAVVTEDHKVCPFGRLHQIPLPVFPAE